MLLVNKVDVYNFQHLSVNVGSVVRTSAIDFLERLFSELFVRDICGVEC